MQLIRFGIAGGIAVLACVAACSSGVGSSVGFGSAGASAGSGPNGGVTSTGGSAIDRSCPQSRPVPGTPCEYITCEYGSAVDPSCNTVARCNDVHVWVLDEATHCPAQCPSRFDERVPGSQCSDPDVCTYLEATCGCAGAITSPAPDAGADAGADADAADASDPDAAAPMGHWQCVRPGNGCPARRPLVGARCIKQMTCDYGTCVFGVPLTYACGSDINGGITWSETSGPACP